MGWACSEAAGGEPEAGEEKEGHEVMNRLMLVISVIWSAFCIVGLGLDLRDGIGRAWFDLLMAALPWVVWLLGLYVVKGRTSEGRQ